MTVAFSTMDRLPSCSTGLSSSCKYKCYLSRQNKVNILEPSRCHNISLHPRKILEKEVIFVARKENIFSWTEKGNFFIIFYLVSILPAVHNHQPLLEQKRDSFQRKKLESYKERETISQERLLKRITDYICKRIVKRKNKEKAK